MVFGLCYLCLAVVYLMFWAFVAGESLVWVCGFGVCYC